MVKTFCQTQKPISLYLQTHFNKTIYDVTYGNNPWGVGLGLQTLFLTNKKTKFKPTIEITADTYLEDDKVLRLTPEGEPIEDLGTMINLFAGSTYHPLQFVYLSFVVGPSFIDGQTLFGIKPSVGFYFSDNRRWTAEVSYINIFNRDKLTGKDFGTISFTVAVKLF